jgi:hypothetical protein
LAFRERADVLLANDRRQSAESIQLNEATTGSPLRTNLDETDGSLSRNFLVATEYAEIMVTD